MPKFQIKAYEEVWYSGEIEAEDEDEAISEFALSLGDVHPLTTQFQYTTTQVTQVKETNHA
jgi:hypothetical protein